MANKKTKTKYVTLSTIMKEYCLSRKKVEKFFPEPKLVKNPHYSSAPPMKLWDEKVVKKIVKRKAVLKEIEKGRARREKRNNNKESKLSAEERKLLELKNRLIEFTPDYLIEQSKRLERKVILHVGPTNSGKTYQSICELKKAKKGAYLGPLRLLALEMYDKLNKDGIKCNLLTGEESIPVTGANITASTIELCNYSEDYDVCVIDEAQMICDENRGSQWLKAICLVKAKTLHICMAPEVKELIINLIEEIGCGYEVIEHERLVPLKYAGTIMSLDDVTSGDALIVFSRKSVLNIAGQLEEKGIKASVIYGALPPESRRREVNRYLNGETKIVVATDAIGMGISLPIKRIIFVTINKFDGEKLRMLTDSEFKQIAGRAGRYKMFDLGQVLTMQAGSTVSSALRSPFENVYKLTIPFPKEMIHLDYSINDLLNTWQSLPKSKSFSRENLEDAIELFINLPKELRERPKELIYELIRCPVNVKEESLVYYWTQCVVAILNKKTVPRPCFGTDSLKECELQYSAYDIYHQLMRRIGIEIDCEDEKSKLCKLIDDYLKEDKKKYIRRCFICNRLLPLDSNYSMCEDCYNLKFLWSDY